MTQLPITDTSAGVYRPRPAGNIIVTGLCEFEVLGIRALLEAQGCVVRSLTGTTPARDDLLIVALSSMPSLGWGKHLVMLDALSDRMPCRMTVLVPDGLCGVVSGLVNVSVRPGDAALPVVADGLQSVIRMWRQGVDREGVSRRHLTPKMQGALNRVVVGRVANSKTEYTHRHLAMGRLSFRSVRQFRAFIAGTEWDKERWY